MTITCSRCQTINPDGARFCLNCGLPLSISCPNCGTTLAPGARFCHHCGYAVAGVAARGPTAQTSPAPQDRLHQYIPPQLLAKLEAERTDPRMEAERRVVTVLFCDVTGSTAMADHLDPEDWAGLMNHA